MLSPIDDLVVGAFPAAFSALRSAIACLIASVGGALVPPERASSLAFLSSDSLVSTAGELDVEKDKLEVKLVSVPANSPLGQLKGADSLIEIYSKSYGENPIVIQGAGAGKEVTARGVLTDILRLSEINTKQLA
jgi:hypothetical protein